MIQDVPVAGNRYSGRRPHPVTIVASRAHNLIPFRMRLMLMRRRPSGGSESRARPQGPLPAGVPGPESPEWFSGHGPTGDILAGAAAERG